MLVFALLASCERPDYNDEIKDTYRTAKEDSRSDVVIEGNLWSKMADDRLKWEKAVSYCENLDEFGYSDWHLPTIDELRTLVCNCPVTESGGSCMVTEECINDSECEYNVYKCKCDQMYFSEDNEGYYSKLKDEYITLWSSTLNRNPEMAMTLEFGSASISTKELDYGLRVRCVRNAEQPTVSQNKGFQ